MRGVRKLVGFINGIQRCKGLFSRECLGVIIWVVDGVSMYLRILVV